MNYLETKLEELEEIWQKRENDLQNALEIRACDLDENVIEVSRDSDYPRDYPNYIRFNTVVVRHF